jgi:hypothetical protein
MLDAGFGTITYLKSRLLPEALQPDYTWDAAIAKLGLGVAGRFNAICNRLFQRVEGQVDEFSANGTALVLRAFPVEVINSVEVRGFTGAVDDFTGGYQLDQRAGMMLFSASPGAATERLVIDYDGGYWLDDGGTMPAGATPLPDDVLEAWVIQCQAWAEARKIFGEISLQSLNPKSERPSALTLATDVAAVLEPYRRFSGE